MLKKSILLLATSTMLSGCASTPISAPAHEGLTWKVEYHEVVNDYNIELDTSKSRCQTIFCEYAVDVSVLVYSSTLAVPRIDSKANIYNLDSKTKYIGTLQSGQKIQMVEDCSYYTCSEYPFSSEGKNYIYNELISGRDVEIDVTRHPSLKRKLFLPSSGFIESLEKLKVLESKPTPMDLAL